MYKEVNKFSLNVPSHVTLLNVVLVTYQVTFTTSSNYMNSSASTE